MNTRIDHLVVMASTLDAGVAWCQATLGITPGPGGEHVQFGTHNRLFKIATPAFALAYLEIIAIDPAAVRAPDTAPRRWFDMDDPALRALVAHEGPRLVHVVAGTDDIEAACAALLALGIDRGPVLPCSRQSARGLLQWRITVRDDGARLFDGALPSLIQWGAPGDAEPLRLHPRNHLPRSGCSLRGIAVAHPEAGRLRAAYAAIGLTGITVESGPADLSATLNTPKGTVVLRSQGA